MLLFFVAVAGRCVAGDGFLGLASEQARASVDASSVTDACRLSTRIGSRVDSRGPGLPRAAWTMEGR